MTITTLKGDYGNTLGILTGEPRSVIGGPHMMRITIALLGDNLVVCKQEACSPDLCGMEWSTC